MTNDNRRSFLKSAIGAAAGLALADQIRAEGQKPQSGGPLLKLSLAAYSFNRYLSLKGKTKPTMTLEDFVRFAVEQNLEAIEPTSYYFADTSDAYLGRFRTMCTRQGLDISGTAVGNDFCKLNAADLEKEKASVKQWIDRAAILGAKTIRIFAGTLPKGDDEETARTRCAAAIQQACEYAAKFGIILALENHGGITATPEQLLAIVQKVNHPNFGVNLDTGNFHTADPYGDLEKIAPLAVVVQLKTEIQAKGKTKEDADLTRLTGMLRKVNFRGYVALEYEAAEDPKTGVPKALTQLRRAMVPG